MGSVSEEGGIGFMERFTALCKNKNIQWPRKRSFLMRMEVVAEKCSQTRRH
jgi:hypothetical protein